jgi:RimJ/RimL family protein N-acetyltransferase
MEARDETRYLETVHDPATHWWLHEIPFARDSEAFTARMTNRDLGASLGQGVEWAIADPETDEYCGAVNLFDFGDLDYKTAEVGYRAHPDARGRGFVTASVKLAVGHALRPEAEGGYGLERIRLGAGDGNLGSLGVARSCGFTETGRDRRCYLMPDGSVLDLIRFDLLASEWRAAAPAAGDSGRR